MKISNLHRTRDPRNAKRARWYFESPIQRNIGGKPQTLFPEFPIKSSIFASRTRERNGATAYEVATLNGAELLATMAAEETNGRVETKGGEKAEIVRHVCIPRPLVLAWNSFAGHEVSTPLTSGRGGWKCKKRTRTATGYVPEKLMADPRGAPPDLPPPGRRNLPRKLCKSVLAGIYWPIFSCQMRGGFRPPTDRNFQWNFAFDDHRGSFFSRNA